MGEEDIWHIVTTDMFHEDVRLMSQISFQQRSRNIPVVPKAKEKT